MVDGPREFLDRLRDLIREDEVRPAFAQLDRHLRGVDRDLQNEAILLLARLSSLESRRRKGLLTEEGERVEMARLKVAALEFLDVIERKLGRQDLPFASATVNFDPPADAQLEKIIGTNHLKSIAWLHRGLAAAASVCRVVTPNGLGTGFLIGANRMLTNHHVIRDQEVAAKSRVEFNYQEDLHDTPELPYAYKLKPEDLRTDKGLDYSVVEVEEDPNNPPLERWGCLTLAPDAKPKAGDHVTIIQHPQGGPKQIALTANQVVNVFEHRLQYTTDTLPGSSGSPVFNDDWNVIALHHAGGNLLTNKRGDRMFGNEGILIRFLDAALGK